MRRILFILAFILFIFPFTISAVQAVATSTSNIATSTPAVNDSPAPQELPNPLGTSDINEMIARIINFVLSLVGSISLLMFVYGGMTWMTSGGAKEKIKTGRDIIVWSVIGLAVVFSSYLIVRFVITGLAT